MPEDHQNSKGTETMTTTTTPTRCESCTGLAGGPRCGDIGWYYISPDATTCRLPKDRPVALCDDCYSLAPELATPTTATEAKWDGWAERRRAEQGVDEPRTTTASDGTTLAAGDKAFNYYDMKPGTVGGIDSDGWFRFTHDDGTSATLNGERVCSLATAAAEPWNRR